MLERGGGGGGGTCNTSSRFKLQVSLDCSSHKASFTWTLLSTDTYLDVTICDRSGIFSGKLFLNVPAELRESWDRKDLNLPLVPKLPILPELSEPFRRSVEGTLPLSEDSTSSVKKKMENIVVARWEKKQTWHSTWFNLNERKLAKWTINKFMVHQKSNVCFFDGLL